MKKTQFSKNEIQISAKFQRGLNESKADLQKANEAIIMANQQLKAAKQAVETKKSATNLASMKDELTCLEIKHERVWSQYKELLGKVKATKVEVAEWIDEEEEELIEGDPSKDKQEEGEIKRSPPPKRM